MSGRITDADSREPIARAVVTIRSIDRSRTETIVADVDGRYRFAGLQAGPFILTAESPESRATHLRQAFGDTAPAGFAEIARANLELKSGEERTGVDIALHPAGAVEGRVLDPWGEPMAEVEVTLMRGTGGPFPIQVRTDDRGEYRLFGIAPGRYRVCAVPSHNVAEAPSEDAGRYVRTCYPSALGEAGAAEVLVASQDIPSIDIRVQRVGSHTATGTVVSATGKAVETGHVRARWLEADRSEATAPVVGGQFVLRGLLPGRHVITATTGSVQRPQSEPPQPAELGIVELNVAGDSAGVVVQVAPSRTIQGRVRFDGRAAPASRGMVVQTGIVPRALSMAFSRPPFGAVGEGGAFGLADVFRVPLTVGVQGLPEGWAVRSVRFDGRDITGRATDLADPAARGNLEIVVTDRVARPLVRVTDGSDAPQNVLYLVVLPADEGRWAGTTGRWLGPTEGGDSSKRLAALLPGEYLIGAFELSDVHPMMWDDAAALKRFAALMTRVTLEEGATQVIDVKVVKPGQTR